MSGEKQTTINCRRQVSDECKHGAPIADSGMDPEGAGMSEDGTWDGESVVCDVCYITIGMPTLNANPGLVGGGRGDPAQGGQVAEPLTVDDALDQLVILPDYDPGTGPQPCVHTFRTGGMMLGAHWTIEKVEAAMKLCGVARLLAGGWMGHDLLVVDSTGPVLFESQPVDGGR